MKVAILQATNVLGQYTEKFSGLDNYLYTLDRCEPTEVSDGVWCGYDVNVYEVEKVTDIIQHSEDGDYIIEDYSKDKDDETDFVIYPNTWTQLDKVEDEPESEPKPEPEEERKAILVEVGDKIKALGYTFDVAKILFQDAHLPYRYNHGKKEYEETQYDIEFLDSKGGYHHWKSYLDGGQIIKKAN